MRTVLVEAAVIVTILPALEFTLEIIVSGGTFLVAAGLAPIIDYFLDPPFLGRGCDVDRFVAVTAHVVDARGDVVALRLEHVSQVELERRLIAAHDEKVRITV